MFPAMNGYSEIRFHGLGQLKVGAKVTMNGMISDCVEGEIFDCMTFKISDYNKGSQNW